MVDLDGQVGAALVIQINISCRNTSGKVDQSDPNCSVQGFFFFFL